MADKASNNYVFAAVVYSNAAPLAHFLGQAQDGVEVVYDYPSELAGGLLDGSVDAALVPVVDFFHHPQLRMIETVGICADGDVWSVLLKCNRPIDKVRTVKPDPASKTSNALAKVLLENHFHLSVEMTDGDADGPADANVVIGDRALCGPPATCCEYDLAGQWKAMTGLPFVFAVWAYRADHPDPQGLQQIAVKARQLGLAGVDELAEIHAARLALPIERCREYLSSVIRYDLGPKEMQAMRLFRELCQSAGVLSGDALLSVQPRSEATK